MPANKVDAINFNIEVFKKNIFMIIINERQGEVKPWHRYSKEDLNMTDVNKIYIVYLVIIIKVVLYL